MVWLFDPFQFLSELGIRVQSLGAHGASLPFRTQWWQPWKWLIMKSEKAEITAYHSHYYFFFFWQILKPICLCLTVKDFQAIPSASEWLKFSDFPSYLSNQYLPSCLGVTSKKHVFFFCLPSKLHFLLSVCCNILSALLSANVSPFLWPWPIFIISHPAICHGLLFPASHPQSLFSTSPSWSLPWNIHLQWFHSTQKPMDSFWIW